MNDLQIEMLIQALRCKQSITDLEKDILDTYHELQKNPMDNSSADRQILSNNLKYPDMWTAINVLPSTVLKSQEEITELDRRYILNQQLICLIAKENVS